MQLRTSSQSTDFCSSVLPAEDPASIVQPPPGSLTVDATFSVPHPGSQTTAAEFLQPGSSAAVVIQSRAKEPEASAGLCAVASRVVRVGVASAVLPATSEFMDVTVGETARVFSEAPCHLSFVAATTARNPSGLASRAMTRSARARSGAFGGPRTNPMQSSSSEKPTQTLCAWDFACSDFILASFVSTTPHESGVGPDAANRGQSHLQAVTGGESAATSFCLRDGLGIHEPGSNTRGERLPLTAPSGRAAEAAMCPAVTQASPASALAEGGAAVDIVCPPAKMSAAVSSLGSSMGGDPVGWREGRLSERLPAASIGSAIAEVIAPFRATDSRFNSARCVVTRAVSRNVTTFLTAAASSIQLLSFSASFSGACVMRFLFAHIVGSAMRTCPKTLGGLL